MDVEAHIEEIEQRINDLSDELDDERMKRNELEGEYEDTLRKLEVSNHELVKVKKENDEMRQLLLAISKTIPEDSDLYRRIMEVV